MELSKKDEPPLPVQCASPVKLRQAPVKPSQNRTEIPLFLGNVLVLQLSVDQFILKVTVGREKTDHDLAAAKHEVQGAAHSRNAVESEKCSVQLSPAQYTDSFTLKEMFFC